MYREASLAGPMGTAELDEAGDEAALATRSR